MPESKLLDDITDPRDRSTLELQLKALNEERKKRRRLAQHSQFASGPSHKDSFSVYDCTNEGAVHRPVSLLEPETCTDIELTHRAPVNVTVQVLMTGSRLSVTAFRCSLTISREVSRCGFDDLHYGTVITQLDDPLHLTPAQCRNAVTQGFFVFEKQTINVTLNSPTVHRYYRYGQLSNEHECAHTSFTSNGQFFEKSYELTIVRVRVSTVKGRYNPSSGRVAFSNGLIGNYADRILLDDEMGLFVWSTTAISCADKISELYEGLATLYPKRNNTLTGQPGDLVMIEQHEEARYAGFVLKGDTRVCTRSAFNTQLTGISILILRPGDPKLKASYHHPDQLAPTDIQSNVGYVHLKRSLHTDRRFAALQSLVCQNERKILSNKLTMIAGDNRHALLDTYGPGHALTRAGSVAYVTVCVPRLAKIRQVTNCSQEIPVLMGNETGYADPLTFVLQPFPTVIPCDHITPVRWKINEHWMCATPSLSSCVPPLQLNPASDDTTTLQDFTVGLGGGIFSNSQRADHRLFMIMAQMREPVFTDLSRTALARSQSTHGRLSYYSDYDLNRLKDEIGSALIPFFTWFGEYWSIVTGVLVCLALAKILLGMCIRMYCTYLQRGCGLWLLASLWHTAFLAVMLPWRVMTAVTQDLKDDLPPDTPGRPGRRRHRNRGSGRNNAGDGDDNDDDDEGPGTDGYGKFPHPPANSPLLGVDEPERGARTRSGTMRMDSSRMEGSPSDSDLPGHEPLAALTNFLRSSRGKRRSEADSRYRELQRQLEEIKQGQRMELQARSGVTLPGYSASAPPAPSTSTDKKDDGPPGGGL